MIGIFLLKIFKHKRVDLLEVSAQNRQFLLLILTQFKGKKKKDWNQIRASLTFILKSLDIKIANKLDRRKLYLNKILNLIDPIRFRSASRTYGTCHGAVKIEWFLSCFVNTLLLKVFFLIDIKLIWCKTSDSIDIVHCIQKDKFWFFDYTFISVLDFNRQLL